MAKEFVGSRIWMILAILFIAISIALSIYLIYDKQNEGDSSVTEDTSLSPSQADILTRYPSFFRTEKQQINFAAKYERMITSSDVTKAPVNQSLPIQRCSFQCVNQNGRRKRATGAWNYHGRSTFQLGLQDVTRDAETHDRFKRQTIQSPWIHHACCTSTPSYTEPSHAQAIWGANVSVIQFRSWRQYFPSEDCSQVPGCSGCTCAQQTTYTSAVIRVGAVVNVSLIEVLGCCKCYNNLP